MKKTQMDCMSRSAWRTFQKRQREKGFISGRRDFLLQIFGGIRFENQITIQCRWCIPRMNLDRNACLKNIRVKKVMVNLVFRIGITLAVVGGLLLYIRFTSMPPKEDKLIKNFNDHRAAFEQLRSMLSADENLRSVANWGVETTEGIFIPPKGNFPLDRYNQYLALLKQVDGIEAYRDEGAHPNLGIGVWGSGFAGETKHVCICWEDQEPPNQVASLDDHYQKRMHGEEQRVVYRHIDGNWYLWTDW